MKNRTRVLKVPAPDTDAIDRAMKNAKLFTTAMVTVFIERSGVLYFKTKNPIHAWRVYNLARQGGVSVPKFVLEYFDRVAKTLTAEQGPSSPKDIAHALELGTRGGPAKARLAAIDQRDLDIVGDVVSRFDHGPAGSDDLDMKDILGIMQRVADERRLSLERVQAVCRKMLGRQWESRI